MHDAARCGRPICPAPAHDPTPVCLMHSRDPRKSDAAFQEEFEAILSAARDGVADFTKFVFTKADYWRREFTAECVFRNAVFTQNADFHNVTFTQYADFDGATFTQDFSFYSARFIRLADFRDARFTQNAHFDWATFTGNARFHGVAFTQNAHFHGATFTLHVSFSGATFKQDADFRDATFAQNADFGDARFTQNADFGGATFTQNADFGGAAFRQEAKFMGTKFLGAAEFRRTRFRHDRKHIPGPVFSLAEFAQPEKVIFYKNYLGQTLFHNCDVSRVNFSLVVWRRRKGSRKRMLFEEVADLRAAEDLKPSKGSIDDRRYSLIAELYQQLKKNFDERKDYWTAGDFHYGEMEMKRLATRPAGRIFRLVIGGILGEARMNRARRWWHRHVSLVALYKYASQYGESYARSALWLGATLLLFALLYPAIGLRYDSAKERAGTAGASVPVVLTYAGPLFSGQPAADRHKAQLRLFGNSCLTAVEIAAFQKEPAYQPVYPWGRLLTLIETLLTSTLAALFFLAVRRQFRR